MQPYKHNNVKFQPLISPKNVGVLYLELYIFILKLQLCVRVCVCACVRTGVHRKTADLDRKDSVSLQN